MQINHMVNMQSHLVSIMFLNFKKKQRPHAITDKDDTKNIPSLVEKIPEQQLHFVDTEINDVLDTTT